MIAYCVSCGERTRVRWPKASPLCCSQHCAAGAFLDYAQVGNFEAAHCPDCGEMQPDCGCDEEEEQ